MLDSFKFHSRIAKSRDGFTISYPFHFVNEGEDKLRFSFRPALWYTLCNIKSKKEDSLWLSP